jgi:diamine N-acetyltransferase
MVDASFQGKGVGWRALELLVDEARADGVAEVTLSVVPGPTSASGFYERFGFVPTGAVHDGETELRLVLDDSR